MVKRHLISLAEHFDKCFSKDVPDNIENFDWTRNLFNVEIADSMLTGNELEELASFRSYRLVVTRLRPYFLCPDDLPCRHLLTAH